MHAWLLELQCGKTSSQSALYIYSDVGNVMKLVVYLWEYTLEGGERNQISASVISLHINN